MSDPIDVAADAIAVAERSVTTAAAREAKAEARERRIKKRISTLAREMGGEDHPFAQELRWTENGLKASLTNVTLVLSHHPQWKRLPEGTVDDARMSPVFAWNTMTHGAIWVDAPPWPLHVNPGDRTYRNEPVTEDDITRIQMFFEQEPYNCRVSAQMASAALHAVAKQHPVHPLQKYLSTLKWDGKPRIDDWLRTHLGATPEEQPQWDAEHPEHTVQYLQQVGRWWLLSAVARAMNPGCQVDSALILEGPQGTSKTSALRVIGGEWYTGALLDLDKPQNLYPTINSRWIIELAEFHSIMKSSAERTKAFMTETHNEWVQKFSNDNISVPRSCVFAATINPSGDDTYLKDPTGERRWWPVRINRDIDLEKLKMDRDNLIAEAYATYAGWRECNSMWELGAKAAGHDRKLYCQSETDRCAKHRWWPTRAETGVLQLAQVERSMPDSWDQVVMRYILTRPLKRICKGIQSREIAVKALDAKLTDHKINGVFRRISECCRRSGGEQRKTGGRGAQVTAWAWDPEVAKALRTSFGIENVDDDRDDLSEPGEALQQGGGE